MNHVYSYFGCGMRVGSVDLHIRTSKTCADSLFAPLEKPSGAWIASSRINRGSLDDDEPFLSTDLEKDPQERGMHRN